jgi:hypothetical protein
MGIYNPNKQYISVDLNVANTSVGYQSNKMGNSYSSSRNHGKRPTDEKSICHYPAVYLGSTIVHVTQDELQDVQEPLDRLYAEPRIAEAKGKECWISIWPRGILVEDADGMSLPHYYLLESIRYCAALRCVAADGVDPAGPKMVKFLPLNSEQLNNNKSHPPLFAFIRQSVGGSGEFECHVFACKQEKEASDLVRLSITRCKEIREIKIGADARVPRLVVPMLRRLGGLFVD